MTALSGELRANFLPGGVRVHTSGPLELRGPVTASKLYYLRNVTAGVFAGDAYQTAVLCAPGATARVESSSATKVYSMPDGCASTTVELCAEPGSRIVWGPHATILQAGSSLRQDTRVTVHEGARVLMAETLVMGRIAAGQRFDFTHYESSLTVIDACDEVTYTEAYRLTPGPDLEAAMGGCPVLTVVHALGDVDTCLPDRLDALCADRRLTGWSALPNRCGYIVKALTESMSQGTALARELLALLEA